MLSGIIEKGRNCGLVRTMGEHLMVLLGRFEGYSYGTKFGANPDIDTGTAEDVWWDGGDYTGFPTGAAETFEVLSDDANDTAAGTGARTVRVYTLDANYVEQEIDVTMNGLTGVVTTETGLRAARAKVMTAGSGGTNAGTITVRHSTTTSNVFITIPPGAGNQTLIGATTVPADKEAVLWRIGAGLGVAQTSGNAKLAIWTREEGGVWHQQRYYIVGAGRDLEKPIYITLSEKTDFKARVLEVSNNNTEVSAEIGYYLVDAA